MPVEGVPQQASPTMPQLLLRNAERLAGHPAFREKDLGIWQTWDWRAMAAEIRAFACGLADLGLARGDRVAIVGTNRPQLYWAFTAVQAAGAVPVPLYADSVAEEMRFVLRHAEVRMAICEDQEQVDKVVSQMAHLPGLDAVIYEEPRGMKHYREPFLHALAAVQERGRRRDAAEPGAFEAAVAEGRGSDLALIAYTSGTTGNPKGVMLTFDALIRSAALCAEMERLTKDEEMLAYLPLAWVGDHFFSVALQHAAGFTVNCPESSDTVLQDLRDIGPTFFLAPPAIFETFLTQITIRMEDAGRFKRWLYRSFMAVAKRAGVAILERKPVPVLDRLLYALGELAVYGPLKANLGLSRVRIAFTGGAPLGEEVFGFYRSIGINLKQLYGQTESSAYICMQRDGDVRSDTVGPPCPGVELRISPEGEVLYRSPGNFAGYFKEPELTRQTLEADGWVHTGDAGIVDDAGHLKVIDRAKDVGRLADGTLFAPAYIENKLKFFPYIREAVTFGTGRPHVAAFVAIDLEAVGNWAERQGLTYTSYAHLASLEPVIGLIGRCVEEVNASLARDSALAGSQIRRFLLLQKELDADDGELTRTRKVRRRIVAERYAPLVEALYGERDRVAFETSVTFEDGRTATLKGDLRIADARAAGASFARAA